MVSRSRHSGSHGRNVPAVAMDVVGHPGLVNNLPNLLILLVLQQSYGQQDMLSILFCFSYPFPIGRKCTFSWHEYFTQSLAGTFLMNWVNKCSRHANWIACLCWEGIRPHDSTFLAAADWTWASQTGSAISWYPEMRFTTGQPRLSLCMLKCREGTRRAKEGKREVCGQTQGWESPEEHRWRIICPACWELCGPRFSP